MIDSFTRHRQTRLIQHRGTILFLYGWVGYMPTKYLKSKEISCKLVKEIRAKPSHEDKFAQTKYTQPSPHKNKMACF